MKKNLSFVTILFMLLCNTSVSAKQKIAVMQSPINSLINHWDVREKPGRVECISKVNDHRVIFECGDICKSNCEVIVNAANAQLQGGSGVCGAIFKQAGWDQLQNYIDTHYQNGCKTGQAVITPSFNLQNHGIRHIIHAVGPIWHGGKNNEHQLLEDTYKNSILVAQANKIESLAFPFISSGIYKFPLEKAAHIAIETILNNSDLVKEIKVVLYSPADYKLFVQIISKFTTFLK